MADYWKSNERHFCTYCKCWLAGNKISINLHESGNHHKGNVRAKLDQMRKTSLEKEKQTQEMNTTLSQMERAATESFLRDVAVNGSSSSTAHYGQETNATATDISLPSKLKRPISQPVQVQCKKAKFVIKTPTLKPVFEPIATLTESASSVTEDLAVKVASDEKVPLTTASLDEIGTWYEFRSEAGELFYWHDTTGASSWTAPDVYLSVEEQKARGLKV